MEMIFNHLPTQVIYDSMIPGIKLTHSNIINILSLQNTFDTPKSSLAFSYSNRIRFLPCHPMRAPPCKSLNCHTNQNFPSPDHMSGITQLHLNPQALILTVSEFIPKILDLIWAGKWFCWNQLVPWEFYPQMKRNCWVLSVFGNWHSSSLFAIDVVNMFCVILNTEIPSIPAPWNLLSKQQLLVDSIFAELIKIHVRFDQIIFQFWVLKWLLR